MRSIFLFTAFYFPPIYLELLLFLLAGRQGLDVRVIRCTPYPSVHRERVFHASRLARNLSRLLPSILRIGTPTFTAEPSLPSPRLGSTIFFPLPISSSPLCIQTHIPACCDYPNGISTLDDYSDDKGGKGARQVEGPPAWDNGTHFARMAKEVIRSWLNVDILWVQLYERRRAFCPGSENFHGLSLLH